MNRALSLALTLVLAATSACSEDPTGGPQPMPDGGMPGSDGGDPVPDTTAPTVVSMTPANGATGVRADTTVVIEFSEAMDQLSVQNSLDTSDLGGVTFSWSNGNKTFTIKPDAPLEYAAGMGNVPDDVVAKQFSVIVGTGARDEAGNAVPIGAQTIFKTLKLLSSTYPRANALTGTASATMSIGDADDFLQIGDDAAAAGQRGFISMDLATLPATAVEVVAATLKATQLSEAIGMAYAKLGDAKGLIMEHGIFAALDNAAYNLTPLSSVGELAQTGDTNLSIDVTAQVQDDLVNRTARGNLSQYRLRFSLQNNADAIADQVYLGRDDLAVEVKYLAP